MSEPKILEPSPESAAELLRRARANELPESDCEIIAAMIGTIAILGQCFENGRLYVKRLLKMIFGVKTEKKKKRVEENEEGRNPDSRKGMFTAGIVSAAGPATIALFFTGRGHAGENIADVLEKRNPLLPPPIQMCDALSRNFSGCGKVVLAHCNAHSRRNFFDVADNFPDRCEYVPTVFQKIYKNDALCKREGMDDMRRLEFHREKSGPIPEEFQIWLDCQFQMRKVEPDSGLGKAISYALEHWEKLTLFPTVPGVPPGQQRLRTDSEKGDTRQEKRLVLQDPARSLRRRHLHEPDPHVRHERDKSLRLPDLPANPFVRGV